MFIRSKRFFSTLKDAANCVKNANGGNFSSIKAVLPKLPFDYSDLEPVLAKDTVEIHHSKHHQTYINNYNTLLVELETALNSGDYATVSALAEKIKFNAGSHYNHSVYWENLAPVKQGGGVLPTAESALRKQLEQQYGSMDNFMNDFIARCSGLRGSGWGWVALDKKTKTLGYYETKDQDPLIMIPNLVPILTIDAWEHSWYLTYKHEKAKYFKEIWKVVNWKKVEERYNNALI